MPEEFIQTQPEVNESTSAENAQVQSSENIVQTLEQPTQQETKSFKVKHLHEEKEIPYEEAPTYIQKGLDYDRVKQKYEDSKPVIGFVEKLAQQNGMSVQDYLKAVDEYQRQQEIETLAQQRSLDPELAEELYLLRQERQERLTQKQQQEQQTKQQQEYLDFFDEFPTVKPEEIPDEVWRIKAERGISITDAYYRYENKLIKNKTAIEETNKKNAESSTGSITGNGDTSSEFISADMFNKNRSNRDWVMKNFEKINKSRSKW